MTLDFDFNPKPQLAKSWTVSDDGLTYTFKLVQDAKWHDGKPFTSADVKFTIEEILLKYHPSGSVMWGNVERIDTPDAYTVVFKLKKKSALLMKGLGPQTGKMMPEHIYEGTEIMKNPANMKPVGTGPFKFVEYKTGSYAVYERNPDYWNPQQPYLDKIILKCIVDESARLAALESGEEPSPRSVRAAVTAYHARFGTT